MRTTNPRGIRNFNPGNIRHAKGTRWQGMSVQQLDPDFVQFTGAKWGVRAIARILITYQDKHGLRTIRQFIERWAPHSENNTERYVWSVSTSMGISADKQLDVYDYKVMRGLVLGIIPFENGPGNLPDGRWYGDSLIAEGLHLAGIVPNTVHGGQAQ